MFKILLKRIVVIGSLILIFFVLQVGLFSNLSIANVSPNLLIILVASIGFMRGSKEGVVAGFFCGLMVDIVSGGIFGFYALLYLVLGYVNGLFHEIYHPDDFRLPILLIAGTSFSNSLVIYFFRFLLRGEFRFFFFLNNIIMLELIYTVAISIFLYRFILYINNKMLRGSEFD